MGDDCTSYAPGIAGAQPYRIGIGARSPRGLAVHGDGCTDLAGGHICRVVTSYCTCKKSSSVRDGPVVAVAARLAVVLANNTTDSCGGDVRSHGEVGVIHAVLDIAEAACIGLSGFTSPLFTQESSVI